MNSNNIAVKVSNLSKMFKVYNRPSDMLWEMISGRPRHRKFWALKDVSFEVKCGEVVGIIGRNGAGKTTMLRIIANTLDRTSGYVEVHGKVSAIMALGTGFNPELNGRENIIMGGLCLGLTKQEITRKMEEIIDFSGLEAFIDQPVKTYSSGMQAKLAFSTAASVAPDVLILDEALSAGDMAFAAKSYARIRQIVTSGATVLLVTHALQIIYDLCNTAICLEDGRIIAMGEPRQVGYAYERIMHEEMAAASRNERRPVYSIALKSKKVETELAVTPGVRERDERRNDSDQSRGKQPEDRDAGEENIDQHVGYLDERILPLDSAGRMLNHHDVLPAEVLDVTVLDAVGHSIHTLNQHQSYTIQVRVLCKEMLKSISIGFRVQNPGGTTIYGTSTAIQGIDVGAQTGDVVCVHFTFECALASGTYVLSSGVARNLGDISEHYLYNMIHYLASAVTIDVVGPYKFAGYADLKSKVKTVHNEPATHELDVP